VPRTEGIHGSRVAPDEKAEATDACDAKYGKFHVELCLNWVSRGENHPSPELYPAAPRGVLIRF
jgi:hypothetical protein